MTCQFAEQSRLGICLGLGQQIGEHSTILLMAVNGWFAPKAEIYVGVLTDLAEHTFKFRW